MYVDLYRVYESEIADINKITKDQQKLRENLQQYEHKRSENEMVKNELTLVEEGDVVYKLIGPILVPQEVNEAKLNVENRLELIGKEITRIEKTYKDNENNMEQKKRKVQDIQNKLITLTKQYQQAAAQQGK